MLVATQVNPATAQQGHQSLRTPAAGNVDGLPSPGQGNTGLTLSIMKRGRQKTDQDLITVNAIVRRRLEGPGIQPLGHRRTQGHTRDFRFHQQKTLQMVDRPDIGTLLHQGQEPPQDSPPFGFRNTPTVQKRQNIKPVIKRNRQRTLYSARNRGNAPGQFQGMAILAAQDGKKQHNDTAPPGQRRMGRGKKTFQRSPLPLQKARQVNWRQTILHQKSTDTLNRHKPGTKFPASGTLAKFQGSSRFCSQLG
jgi:hypothetical protein